MVCDCDGCCGSVVLQGWVLMKPAWGAPWCVFIYTLQQNVSIFAQYVNKKQDMKRRY